MKIGVYKPYKTIYFKDNNEDHAGWSFEVVNLIKILVQNGHTVDILSSTDLQNNELKNISICPVQTCILKQYDRIFIFCGTTNEQIQLDIEKCRQMTVQLDFIFTDYKLKPHTFKIFDNIYTQSKNVHTYAALETLVLYNKTIQPIKQLNKKDILFYFGGTERNRLDDIIEYIWRPDVRWYGKSNFFDLDRYVSYAKNNELIQRSKYSIVIMDLEYNYASWATPRYFENIINNTICFVDNKCDSDQLLLAKDDFRRVNNYKEMHEKIMLLENNLELKLDVIKAQHNEIKKAYIDGRHVYSYLFNEK